MMAPNMPDCASSSTASPAGGTVTTINPTYDAEEVRFQLEDAGATMLITIRRLRRRARRRRSRAPRSRRSLSIGGAEGTGDAMDAARRADRRRSPVDSDDDVVVLPYSSGTTGLPKGVHAHAPQPGRQHRPDAARCVEIRERRGDARRACRSSTSTACTVLMNYGLVDAARRIVTMPRFDLQQALRLIAAAQGDARSSSCRRWCWRSPSTRSSTQYDLSRVVRSSRAPRRSAPSWRPRLRRAVGCDVVQGYGMTELSPVTPCHASQGSTGRARRASPCPNTECRVVDPATGEDLGAGAAGELWVRGPQVMKGYLNNAEATRARRSTTTAGCTPATSRVVDDDGITYRSSTGSRS